MSRSARQARAVLARLDTRVRRTIAAAVNRTVDDVGRAVQIGVPRVTGDLAASMALRHAAPRGSQAVIAGSVAIGRRDGQGDAAAVEFGTAQTQPHPFFRVAVGHVVPGARSDLIRTLKRSISS